MSTCISFREQYVWVSNKRFNTLMLFAIEVGQNMASTELEQSFVQSLQETYKNFMGGFDFEMENEFTSLDKKKFWSCIFSDVASAAPRNTTTPTTCLTQNRRHKAPLLVTQVTGINHFGGSLHRTQSDLKPHYGDSLLEDGNDEDKMNLRV